MNKIKKSLIARIILTTLLLVILVLLYFELAYSYKENVLHAKFGNVSVSVRGEYKYINKIPRIVKYGEPYTIIVEFNTKNNLGKDIKIDLLGISTKTKNWNQEKIIEAVNDKEERNYKRDPKKWKISGLNKNEKLSDYFNIGWLSHSGYIFGVFTDHEPITISFDVRYGDQIESFNTTLEPKFSFRISNIIWEAMMDI